MKTVTNGSIEAGRAPALQAAFSLPEALIATSIFLLLVGGVVSANLFGMRMFQLTENKLRTGDGARKAFGMMADEIRKCSTTWVGDVTNGFFVASVDGQPQAGSAILVEPTTNATNYVLYYLNPSDQSFRRFVSSTGTTVLLAETVTNHIIFSAEDCLGNVLTNGQNNRVIHASLDFFTAQPWLPNPERSRLETSVTRRRLQ